MRACFFVLDLILFWFCIFDTVEITRRCITFRRAKAIHMGPITNIKQPIRKSVEARMKAVRRGQKLEGGGAPRLVLRRWSGRAVASRARELSCRSAKEAFPGAPVTRRLAGRSWYAVCENRAVGVERRLLNHKIPLGTG